MHLRVRRSQGPSSADLSAPMPGEDGKSARSWQGKGGTKKGDGIHADTAPPLTTEVEAQFQSIVATQSVNFVAGTENSRSFSSMSAE